MQWFLQENCFHYFGSFCNSVVSFLVHKQFREQLVAVRCDRSYLSDILKKLNLLNELLQGEHDHLISYKEELILSSMENSSCSKLMYNVVSMSGLN